MNNDELIALYSKLLASGRDREDFASWAVMKVMEGWAPNPDVLWKNYCLKDYQENHFEKPKTDSLDAPIDENEGDSRTLHDVLAEHKPEEDEDFDPESQIDMVEVKALALQLIPQRERFLIELKEAGVKKVRALKIALGRNRSMKNRMPHQLGWNNAVMAFNRYNALLAAAYAMKLREAVGDKTRIDTRLEVQWVTMP